MAGEAPRVPQKAAKELQKDYRRKRKRQKSLISYACLKVFCFCMFSAELASKRSRKGSETAQKGPKKGPNEPQKAQRWPENCLRGCPESAQTAPGGARKPSVRSPAASEGKMAANGRPLGSWGPRAGGMSSPRGGPQEGLPGLSGKELVQGVHEQGDEGGRNRADHAAGI